MSGELENVTVTGDTNFDRALKAAVQKGGSDPDAVLAALKEELSISGGVLSFSISGLGGGSAGRQGLSVLFESGTNPTAAANNAVTNWLGVLRGLAGSGAYSAHVSMVQVEGGYILAIAVTVEQPGGLGSDDDDDDTPDPGPGPVTVDNVKDINELLEAIKNNSGNLAQTTITLTEDYAPDDLDQSLDCGGATVVLTGSNPLFNTIATNVTLSNLNLEVQGQIVCIAYAGGITEINYGTITGCDVTITDSISTTGNSITFAGGIAGSNKGINPKIENCTVTGGNISASYAGGIAGTNESGATIQGCTVTGSSVTATSKGLFPTYAGGIVGGNDGGNDDSIQDCEVSGSSISGDNAGGIVGWNSSGSVQGCEVSGSSISGDNAGGIVGYPDPYYRDTNTVGEDVSVNGTLVAPTL